MTIVVAVLQQDQQQDQWTMKKNDKIMNIPCRLIVQSNNYSLVKKYPTARSK